MKCKWRYFVVINNDKEDIVEGKEVPGDGIPVCNDFTVAKYFLSPEELVKWVKKNTSLILEEGEYHIEGHYLPCDVWNGGDIYMNNPFRSQLWKETIRNENKLYPSEFCMSMTDPNGVFVRLSEINEMISDGILRVDFDKLEQRIFDKTVIKCG